MVKAGTFSHPFHSGRRGWRRTPHSFAGHLAACVGRGEKPGNAKWVGIGGFSRAASPPSERGFSEIIATINDVPAGGKYANRFMKIVALLPLDWVQAAWPRMREVPFVDDTKLRLIGKQRQIRKLSQRPQALIDCLERGMQLEASRGSEGVEGKSGYLCSTPEASEALADDMELLGLGHCEAKRWLGVDYQPAARYNSQGTRRASARKKRGVCVELHCYAALVQLVVSRIVPAGRKASPCCRQRGIAGMPGA